MDNTLPVLHFERNRVREWNDSLLLRKIALWLFFAIGFALLPFLFAWTATSLGDTLSPIGAMIEQGSVYLIIVPLLGDIIGRVLMKRDKDVLDLFTFVVCLVLAILSTFEFGILTELSHAHRTANPGAVWNHSIWYLLSTALLGVAVILKKAD
jgi:hypothetical protein